MLYAHAGHDSLIWGFTLASFNFQIYSTLCGVDIPKKLQIFSVDYNGKDIQSSGLILWENITVINGIYQIEWPVL